MIGQITDKVWKGMYHDARNKEEATENGVGEGAHQWGTHTELESLFISVSRALLRTGFQSHTPSDPFPSNV